MCRLGSIKMEENKTAITERADEPKKAVGKEAAAVGEKKKTVFSAIQPTGNLTIGNYLGALGNFGAFQRDYDCFYCVADMHAITVRQEPSAFRKNTYSTLALFLAAGLDPEKSTIFIQSQVPQHAELCWALNTVSYVGEMNRMTQYKDKSRRHADNINMGLMDYPVLMAADILLYRTELVPIGKDQKQHLELARTLAERFNSVYGETFVVPDGYMPKEGAKIMSLADPSAKMSKSDENENAFVAILEEPDSIRRKFRRAVTDSETEVRFDEINKPGVSNLLTIYSKFADKPIPECEKEFEGSGYGVLKERTAEAVIEGLRPVREEHKRIVSDKAYLESVMKIGAEKAYFAARKTLSKVYRKLGFIAKIN